MLTLYRYRLARATDDRLFAYGYDKSTAEVRILELRHFDETTLAGVTQDGVSIALEGAPAFDMNAGAFWAYYCGEHGIERYKDVTPTGGLARP